MDSRLSMSTIKAFRDRSETQGNDAPLKTNQTCLQDMPIEILDHIISFLSAQSILNLVVNRAFRQICEQNLYHNIRILSPGRTFHLCNTFVLRPDLALLVRDLEICIQPDHGYSRREHAAQILPTFSREEEEAVFTLVEAIALAKNVRSFHAIGGRDPAPLRDLVCGMKLTRLKITDFRLLINRDPKRDEEYMSCFRTILQAQPLLEILELPNSTAIAGWIEHPDLQSTSSLSLLPKNPSSPRIKGSDVPSLRSLVANTSVAASFLAIAAKLESLSIPNWDSQLSYFLLHAERRGHQIRSLSFTLPWREFLGWGGIGNVLRCFPNVETLAVATWWLKSYKGVDSKTNFLGQVSQKIHLLPLLRKLEVYYEGCEPPNLEVTDEQLVALKTSCPRLECVIDPLGRIWAYTAMTDRECYGSQILGRFIRQPHKLLDDIPYPNPT